MAQPVLRTISSLFGGRRSRVKPEQWVQASEENDGERILRLRYTVSDLVDIDNVKQAFKIKILIHVRWREDLQPFKEKALKNSRDEALEAEPDEAFQTLCDTLDRLEAGPPRGVPWAAARRVWDPKIVFENEGDEMVDDEKPICTLQIVEGQPGSLWLNHTRRLTGEFRCAMALQKFPFDKQLLVIKILTQNPVRDTENPQGNAAKIEGQRVAEGDEFASKYLRSENPAHKCLMLDEWQLSEAGHDVIDHISWKHYKHLEDAMKLAPVLEKYSRGKTYSRLYIALALARRPGYYVSKIYGPLCLLGCTSFAIYRIPDLTDQIATIVTVLLAIVAYQYVVSSMVPKIAYNTELDLYIVGCFGFQLVILISCVALDLFGASLEASADTWLIVFCVEFFCWIMFHVVMVQRVGMLNHVVRRLLAGYGREGSIDSQFPS